MNKLLEEVNEKQAFSLRSAEAAVSQHENSMKSMREEVSFRHGCVCEML